MWPPIREQLTRQSKNAGETVLDNLVLDHSQSILTRFPNERFARAWAKGRMKYG